MGLAPMFLPFGFDFIILLRYTKLEQGGCSAPFARWLVGAVRALNPSLLAFDLSLLPAWTSVIDGFSSSEEEDSSTLIEGTCC